LLAGLLAVITVFGVPLAAQENSDANISADSQMGGTVRTADGTGLPGTTLRVIQTSTGKAWITWTDDDGSYEFPALPAGHYRIEISQLGFAPATKEIDLNSGVKTPFDLKLDVGTLAAITSPAPTENAAKTSNLPPSNESTKSARAERLPRRVRQPLQRITMHPRLPMEKTAAAREGSAEAVREAAMGSRAAAPAVAPAA
jgi:hypothetical protein